MNLLVVIQAEGIIDGMLSSFGFLARPADSTLCDPELRPFVSFVKPHDGLAQCVWCLEQPAGVGLGAGGDEGLYHHKHLLERGRNGALWVGVWVKVRGGIWGGGLQALVQRAHFVIQNKGADLCNVCGATQWCCAGHLGS